MNARASGFTLVELLVALVIFSTMAAIAYSGLGAVTRSHETLDARERTLAALGRSLALIERDLRSVAARPVRDRDGRRVPALAGSADAVELSTYGRGRAAGGDLGLVERVGYVRDGDGLRRHRWRVLDQAAGTRPESRPLLPGAEQLRLRYLAADGRWHGQWPPATGGESIAPEALPRAVECVIALPVYGEVRRLIELPEASRP